ncbi:MAG: hypothetical protein GX605_11040, partial [Chloroflexi bacterium]|nr:hypothetical protein [Chloroflexota bacterium]
MIEGRTQGAPWVGNLTLSTWQKRFVDTSFSRCAIETRPLYRWSKRALDVTLAVIALVLLSPVLGALALAIKLDSPGPVIFSQERMGKNGRRFTCYKFRSMHHNHGQEHLHRQYSCAYVNGHQAGDAVFKPANGDVVTKVGRVLRKTSLDELPQLLNIL